MILFPDWKLCLVTPARNASSAIHAVAGRLGGQCFFGPAPEGTSHDKHTPTIPAEALEYRVVIVLRDPVDRLISLYHHHCQAEARHGRAGTALYFFAAAVANREPFLAWFYRWTQAQYLEWAQVQGIHPEGWSIGQTNQELCKLAGKSVRFETINPSDRRPASAYLKQGGPTVQAAVDAWGADDYAAWPMLKGVNQ